MAPRIPMPPKPSDRDDLLADHEREKRRQQRPVAPKGQDRPLILPTVRVSGTVANNGTMDVDGLQPGHLYAIHINVHWEGTQTPHTYGTTTGGVAVPPVFYGEITFGSGAHVRDKRIVSYAGASSIDGYTVSGFYEAGEGLYVQARAFPPTFYPTTITCDLNFTAHHLRPLA